MKTELRGNFDFNNTTRNILAAFHKALESKHKLPEYVLSMEGMSGIKYRYWINNFISSQESPRYLEIGSWKGSTACSAMAGNKLSLTCIDNWSQFSHSTQTKNVFLRNVKRCSNSKTNLKVIENNFKEVDYKSIGKFNIYLFDGPHFEQDQYDGIKLALPALDKTFVLIVDDWNWEQVQNGTFKALNDYKITTCCSITVKTDRNSPAPTNNSSEISPELLKTLKIPTDWHNGYFIAFCSLNK